MSKKYRLLKDLPNIKAGAILTVNNLNKYEAIDKYGETAFLNHKLVENNTDWFERIKEEDNLNSIEYKIAVLSWKLVNKIHNEGMPDDLWKRRQFFY